jgi:5-methylcytosine-specific restriction protein A
MALLTRNRVHRQPFLGHSEKWYAERDARMREQRDPISKQLYDSSAWQTLRRIVLEDANYRCATEQCKTRATVVDHVLAHRGDSMRFFDRDNLRALCKRCHDRKTARVDGAFGRTPRQK